MPPRNRQHMSIWARNTTIMLTIFTRYTSLRLCKCYNFSRSMSSPIQPRNHGLCNHHHENRWWTWNIFLSNQTVCLEQYFPTVLSWIQKKMKDSWGMLPEEIKTGDSTQSQLSIGNGSHWHLDNSSTTPQTEDKNTHHQKTATEDREA